MDHHAAGGAVKHGSWKLIRKKDATNAAKPGALDFDGFCTVVRVHVKCMFANMLHPAYCMLSFRVRVRSQNLKRNRASVVFQRVVPSLMSLYTKDLASIQL